MGHGRVSRADVKVLIYWIEIMDQVAEKEPKLAVWLIWAGMLGPVSNRLNCRQ